MILGALVIADPNTFVGPSEAARTIAEPHGESLDVNALPLQPGNVAVHTYLVGDNRPADAPVDRDDRDLQHGGQGRCPLLPRRPGPLHRPGPPHQRGMDVSGSPAPTAPGHALGGSFTIPIS